MEKVKLIRGSKKRAEEVRETLKRWGGMIDGDTICENEDYYYYVDPFGYISCLYYDRGNSHIAEGRAEIYELPSFQPECKFKPFSMVLVRDSCNEVWEVDLFLRYDKDEEDYQYRCLRGSWNQCIKYKGNEELLGTKNNTK